MNKKISLLMAAVGVVLGAVCVALSWSGTDSVRAGGRAIKLPAGQIDAIEIYRGDKQIAGFAKNSQSGEWKVDLPRLQAVKNAADRQAMEDLFAFLSRAELRPAKNVSRLEAGLEGGNVLQLIARKGEKASSVFLGGYSKDGSVRYFASDDDPHTVLQAESSLTRVFDRDESTLRSLDVFDLGSRQPDRICIYPGSGEKPMELDLTADGWVLGSPINWPADNARVGAILRLCAMLRATGIVSGQTVEDDGRHPALMLRLGGREQKVVFVARAQGGMLARRMDRGEVYELTMSGLELITGAAAETMRSRKLALLKGREVAGVELTAEDGRKLRLEQRDGQWTAGGAFSVEKTAAENLLRSLDNLVLRAVVDDGEAKITEYGLDHPQMNISAFDAGGAEVAQLKVATVPLAPPLHGQDQYFAKLSGRKQIVELEPLLGNFFLQDFLQYRSRLVSNDDYKDILKIRIVGLNFDREYWQNSPTQYQMAKPDSVLLGEKPNWEMMRLAKDLAGLRCEGFVPEKKAENADLGLDRPQLKTILTMRSVGGGADNSRQVRELAIGNSIKIPAQPAVGLAEQEYYYARLTGVKEILILNKKFVDRLFMEYK